MLLAPRSLRIFVTPRLTPVSLEAAPARLVSPTPGSISSQVNWHGSFNLGTVRVRTKRHYSPVRSLPALPRLLCACLTPLRSTLTVAVPRISSHLPTPALLFPFGRGHRIPSWIGAPHHLFTSLAVCPSASFRRFYCWGLGPALSFCGRQE